MPLLAGTMLAAVQGQSPRVAPLLLAPAGQQLVAAGQPALLLLVLILLAGAQHGDGREVGARLVAPAAREKGRQLQWWWWSSYTEGPLPCRARNAAGRRGLPGPVGAMAPAGPPERRALCPHPHSLGACLRRVLLPHRCEAVLAALALPPPLGGLWLWSVCVGGRRRRAGVRLKMRRMLGAGRSTSSASKAPLILLLVGYTTGIQPAPRPVCSPSPVRMDCPRTQAPTPSKAHLHALDGVRVCGALGPPPLRQVHAHLALEGLQGGQAARQPFNSRRQGGRKCGHANHVSPHQGVPCTSGHAAACVLPGGTQGRGKSSRSPAPILVAAGPRKQHAEPVPLVSCDLRASRTRVGPLWAADRSALPSRLSKNSLPEPRAL